jgi:pyruvate carboxylase subunit B
MPGNVMVISVKPGEKVNEGDELAVIEAMKMETPVKSPCSGTVAAVRFSQGSAIGTEDVLMSIV